MCVFWTANKPMRWIGADTFPVPLTQPTRFAKRNKKVKAKSSSWTSTAKKMYDITVLYTNAMFCMRMILLFLNFALVGTSSSFAFSSLCWTRRKWKCPSGGYKPHHQEKRDQGNFLVKLKGDKGKKNQKRCCSQRTGCTEASQMWNKTTVITLIFVMSSIRPPPTLL